MPTSQGRHPQGRPAGRSALIQVAVILGLIIVVAGVAVAVLKLRDGSTAADPTTPPSTAAPAGFTAAGGVEVGNPEAPVTLTVIEDFACPHCQVFAISNAGLLGDYADGDDVLVEYRPVAFLDRASTDEYSSRALNAAACVVNEDESLWSQMHLQLMANQPASGGPGLTDAQLLEVARMAGADEDAVATCIAERDYADWVRATTEKMLDQDFFTGTPTVLVDGEPVDDISSAGVEAAVAAALAR
ncbi:thioredoxin domain-containing protein [Nocardioides limicola]|uniref:thioredoxin domain-containing protein n=1 Tax=Nocardioides limicola TaxID=2803368 RepID=UPI00193B2197|nr:thioredoxin domain-containing protein [Nocardioides sp. DJM-14]